MSQPICWPSIFLSIIFNEHCQFYKCMLVNLNKMLSKLIEAVCPYDGAIVIFLGSCVSVAYRHVAYR